MYEFLNDRASVSLVYIPYYATAENITDNVFHNNSAAYMQYTLGHSADQALAFLWAVLVVFHALITGIKI